MVSYLFAILLQFYFNEVKSFNKFFFAFFYKPGYLQFVIREEKFIPDIEIYYKVMITTWLIFLSILIPIYHDWLTAFMVILFFLNLQTKYLHMKVWTGNIFTNPLQYRIVTISNIGIFGPFQLQITFLCV